MNLQLSKTDKKVQQPRKEKKCLRSNTLIQIIYNNECFLVTREGKDANSVNFRKLKQYSSISEIVYEEHFQSQEIKVTQFEEIYGITTLSKKTFLVLVTQSQKVGQIKGKPIYKVKKVEFVEIGFTIQQQPLQKHLKQSFSLLSLYYSAYNLCQRLQFSYQLPALFEHSFCCNYLYTLEHKNFPFQLLTKFIFGFVETKERQIQGVIYRQTIISRGNYNHVGRRWFRRGLNSDAHAASQYENQFILEIKDNNTQSIYSYLQLRGSIPVLWSNTPNFGVKPELRISSNYELTAALFKQFVQRQEKLQKQVKMISLISKSGSQDKLGQSFLAHLQNLNTQFTTLVCFDYNKEYSLFGKTAFQNLFQSLSEDFRRFDFFKINSQQESYGEKIHQCQRGAFRTNCIDSVDRTNYMQMLISKVFVISALENYKKKDKRKVSPFEHLLNQALEIDFKNLWINNGNQISIQNNGSTIMKVDNYNQRNKSRALGGILKDFLVGTKRHFYGHFLDYYYQNCLDLHFKKLKLQENIPEISGNRLKGFSLFLSVTTFISLPLFVYLLLKKQITDQSKKQVLSIAGSLTATGTYYYLLRRSSNWLLQTPINSSQHQ